MVRRMRVGQRLLASPARRLMPVATPASTAASLASITVSASPPTRLTSGTQP